MRTRRRLNLKFLLLLIVVSVATAGGVHLLHQFQVGRNAKALLAQADKAEREGDLAAAAEQIGLYLSYRPKDEAALARNADLLEQVAATPEQWGRVLQVYRGAIRESTDPKREATLRRRLAELALRFRDYPMARRELETLRKGEPKDPELADLYAQAREAAGQSEPALKAYAEAIASDPSRVETYPRYAILLRSSRRAEEADALMDAKAGSKTGLIARNPKSAAAYIARARYRRQFDVEPASAKGDVERARALAPDDLDVLQAGASLALEDAQRERAERRDEAARSAVDRARADLSRAVGVASRELERSEAAAKSKAAAGDRDGAYGDRRRAIDRRLRLVALYGSLSDLEAQAGRREEAISSLRRAVAVVPKDLVGRIRLEWALADLLIDVGRDREAEDVLKILREHKSLRPELLAYLEGRLRMARGDWEGAAAQLEKVQGGLADRAEQADRSLAKQALVQLGRSYEQIGDVDRRLSAYRRAAELSFDADPLRDVARLGLADALVDRGEVAEAIEQYRAAWRADRPPVEAGLALARLLSAEARGAEADGRKPNWAEVEELLADLARRAPLQDSEIAALRADVASARGRTSDAREALEKDRDRHPDLAAPWVRLAALEVRSKNPEAVRAVLEKAKGSLRDPDQAFLLRLAMAALWAQAGGEPAVQALTALEKEAEALPAPRRDALRRALATSYARIGRPGESDRLWGRVVEESKGDVQAHLARFDLALRATDKEADARAERIIEGLRRLEDDPKTPAEVEGPYWRYGRARLLLRRAEGATGDRRHSLLAEARGLLKQADRPRLSAQVEAITGLVDELDGDPDAAVDHYQKAILERGVRDPEIIRRTARLLEQRQRFDQATRVLDRLREGAVPLSDDLRRLAADVAAYEQNAAQALELAKSAVSEDSDDYRDLIWLAQKRWAAQRSGATKDSAEPLYRKAVAKAPKAPSARLALVTYLAANGRKADAEAEVAEAEKALPEGQSRLALARCNALIGRDDRARQLFAQAERERPDDVSTLREVAAYHLQYGPPAEAERLLKRVVARGRGEDASWARRALALALASGGDVKRGQEALALLDPKAATPADIRARARVLASQPIRERRLEAVSLLEGLQDRRPANAEDQRLLAGLYESVGQWPKARLTWQRLVESEGTNPTYLADLTSAYLRHDEPDAALATLDRLEAVAPRQAATTALRARYLHAKGQDDRAIELLRSLARTDPATIRPVTLLLEQLGLFDAAEELLRGAARSGRPDDALALAAFLGRRGQVDPALTICEGLWGKADPARIVGTAVTALFRAPHDSEARDRVARRIERESRERPGQPAVELGLADVRILQGRYEDAEAALRKYIAPQGSRPEALNNLAWLLALRGDRVAEARDLVARAIAQSGEVPEMLDTRAVVELAAGLGDRAVKDLSEAIAQRPADATMYFHLAQAYRALNRRGDATESFRKATRDLGLTRDAIHPLERPAFDRLAAAPATK